MSRAKALLGFPYLVSHLSRPVVVLVEAAADERADGLSPSQDLDFLLNRGCGLLPAHPGLAARTVVDFDSVVISEQNAT
jgi:hypothetical protein